MPDEARRPVSAYSVSKRLSIPYETVRRHIRDLVQQGRCEAWEDGFVVPAKVFGHSRSRAETQAVLDAVRNLVAACQAAGFQPDPAAAPSQPMTAHHVGRLATTYAVEGIQLMADPLGLGVQSALVLHTISQLNTGHIRDDPKLSKRYAALSTIPEDHERKPATVYELSRKLHLPYETARRDCMRLVDQNLLTRDAQGRLIVPQEVFARPATVAAYKAFSDLTARFLDQVAHAPVSSEPELVSA